MGIGGAISPLLAPPWHYTLILIDANKQGTRTMNKGQTIKKLISEGMDNDGILILVDTTLNSIRWYRSKMAKANGPLPRIEDVKPIVTSGLLRRPAPSKFFRKTVGDAMEEFGFADEVRACLERLNASHLFSELSAWGFITNATVTGRFGQCSYRKQTIEVHATLLDKPEDLRQTFLHELAHALDKMINGRSSHHGRAWQSIMRFGFQIDAHRTGNNMSEASAALRELRAKKAVETWVCTGCGEEHPIMRKRKYPASSYRHSAKGCNSPFRVK